MHRIPLSRSRVLALLTIAGCLLLPAVVSIDPLPALARRNALRRANDAPALAPPLALQPPRGALAPPVQGRRVLRTIPVLSASAIRLVWLALAGIGLTWIWPVLHPFSMVALGLPLAASALPGDKALAIALYLGACLVGGLPRPMGAVGNGRSVSAQRRHQHALHDCVQRIPLRNALIRMGTVCVPALLLMRVLRTGGMLFAPFLQTGAWVLLAGILFASPRSRIETAPLPQPFRTHAGLVADRLLAMLAAATLGWAAAWTAGNARIDWSPHALSVTLAGLFVLSGKRQPRMRCTAPDPIPLGLGLTANLLAPIATGEVAWAASRLSHPDRSTGDIPGWYAWVLAAGFMTACVGGLGVPAGGGAWLADVAGVPAQASAASAALVGFALGGGVMLMATRGLRRLACRPNNGLGVRLTAWLRQHLLWPVALTLSLGMLGGSGLLLLLLAWWVGQLPEKLQVDPLVLSAVALAPFALGAPGVALPFPALQGWLP